MLCHLTSVNFGSQKKDEKKITSKSRMGRKERPETEKK